MFIIVFWLLFVMVDLTELLNSEHEKIDKWISKQKLVASYIVGLIQKDYDKFVGIFGDNSEELFSKVKHQLEVVERIVDERGVICRYGWAKSSDDPGVLLGWLKSKPETQSGDTYKIRITNLGKKVVREYKQIFKT